MRILHLIPTLSGGGAERQLALMAGQHAAMGIKVAVIYHGDGPNLRLLQNSSVMLFPLLLRSNHDPKALWSIVQIIRNWKPDVVQSWLPQMDILGGIAAMVTGLPHILSERSSAMAYGSEWKSRLRIFIGRHASTIIANSQAGARYWRDKGGRSPLHVIVNAVTPYEVHPGNTPPGMHNPAILYAGRLDAAKNLENAMSALAIALAKNALLNAYILGTGPQEAEVRQWIARTQVADRIHMIGYVNNLYPWYSHADVFISVSDFEGHPNVVLEAASVGCPLVLSDIPEHRETIPADGALFVDGHDTVRIADAILSSLADKGASAMRVKASQQFVAGLSVESQAAHYLEIYQRLVNLKA